MRVQDKGEFFVILDDEYQKKFKKLNIQLTEVLFKDQNTSISTSITVLKGKLIRG